MTIHLPEGRQAFVRSLLADGRFASECEVVDQALGLLQERERQRVETPEPAESPPAHKPIWEVIQEISATVPDEVWDTVPTDLAAKHDRYIR